MGQLDTVQRLTLRLKSKGHNCQYCHEIANLVKYQNEKVANLRQGPTTNDHSGHLATVKQRAWSYPAQFTDSEAVLTGTVEMWRPGEDQALGTHARGMRDCPESHRKTPLRVPNGNALRPITLCMSLEASKGSLSIQHIPTSARFKTLGCMTLQALSL